MNFERSHGLGPGQKALGRLGLGYDSLGRSGTESLWDSNPLGLLGCSMPIPGFASSKPKGETSNFGPHPTLNVNGMRLRSC